MTDAATATPTLWQRIVSLVHRYLDIIPKLVDHVIGATNEMDNQTPSSSRVYGGMIFVTVLALQLMIIGVLCWKILRLDPNLANAPAILTIYSKILLAFFLWSILFDVATALSLYGVNCWKYVAAMRCGVMPTDTDDLGELKPVAPPVPPAVVPDPAAPAAPVAQVTPPPGQVE